jgi:hypothetical protein
MEIFNPQESSNIRDSIIAGVSPFNEDHPVRDSVPRCFGIVRFDRFGPASTWRPPARFRAPAARRTGFDLVA